MPMQRYKPEQIVTVLRQTEVAMANGKSTLKSKDGGTTTERQAYRRWQTRSFQSFSREYCSPSWQSCSAPLASELDRMFRSAHPSVEASPDSTEVVERVLVAGWTNSSLQSDGVLHSWSAGEKTTAGRGFLCLQCDLCRQRQQDCLRQCRSPEKKWVRLRRLGLVPFQFLHNTLQRSGIPNHRIRIPACTFRGRRPPLLCTVVLFRHRNLPSFRPRQECQAKIAYG